MFIGTVWPVLITSVYFLEKSLLLSNDPVFIERKDFSKEDFSVTPGSELCMLDVQPNSRLHMKNSLEIGSGIKATDIFPLQDRTFVALNGSQSSDQDFSVILHTKNFITPITFLDTGPGIAAITYANGYVFAANMSTKSQLQVIDVHDMYNPTLIRSIKLPFAIATSTSYVPRTIFFRRDIVFIGTEKWSGPELLIFNVVDPYNPYYVGGVEIGSVVNSITAVDSMLYLATDGPYELHQFSIKDDSTLILENRLTFKGNATQEGKRLFWTGKFIFLGRTVGGFNVVDNPEVVVIERQLDNAGTIIRSILEYDVGESIYGIYGNIQNGPLENIATTSELVLITAAPHMQAGVATSSGNGMEFENTIFLNSKPHTVRCFDNEIWIATDGPENIIRISITP